MIRKFGLFLMMVLSIVSVAQAQPGGQGTGGPIDVDLTNETYHEPGNSGTTIDDVDSYAYFTCTFTNNENFEATCAVSCEVWYKPSQYYWTHAADQPSLMTREWHKVKTYDCSYWFLDPNETKTLTWKHSLAQLVMWDEDNDNNLDEVADWVGVSNQPNYMYYYPMTDLNFTGPVDIFGTFDCPIWTGLNPRETQVSFPAGEYKLIWRVHEYKSDDPVWKNYKEVEGTWTVSDPIIP